MVFIEDVTGYCLRDRYDTVSTRMVNTVSLGNGQLVKIQLKHIAYTGNELLKTINAADEALCADPHYLQRALNTFRDSLT